MEAQEEAMGSNSSSSTGECPYPAVVKRKRTKRQRAFPSPPPLLLPIATSSASSADFSATTEEEEDMAHCLILLAQGRGLDSPPEDGGGVGVEKFTSRRFTEAATTGGGKPGFYVYECKTCNKCFPSFQALGGHRASHKKPKMAIPPAAVGDKIKSITDEDGLEISMNSFSKPPIAVPANSAAGNKLRVHECSICGSEFSSGQALGGHMRRHRPAVVPESQEVKKERNVFSLDLNLPAPSDENPGEFHKLPPPQPSAAFAFADKRPMVFSATTALVDCHY